MTGKKDERLAKKKGNSGGYYFSVGNEFYFGASLFADIYFLHRRPFILAHLFFLSFCFYVFSFLGQNKFIKTIMAEAERRAQRSEASGGN